MKGEMKMNESVFKGKFFVENSLHFYKNIAKSIDIFGIMVRVKI